MMKNRMLKMVTLQFVVQEGSFRDERAIDKTIEEAESYGLKLFKDDERLLTDAETNLLKINNDPRLPQNPIP